MNIKKVLICGLGAVGVTFGSKILDNKNIQLKILVDEERLKKYTKTPPTLNGGVKIFDYITPNQDFTPDLIIISTKSNALKDVLCMLEDFVTPETIIISLINGISSEEIISAKFPSSTVLKSYFIGHSAVRVENTVTQDGIGEIVVEKNDTLAEFFNTVGINFSNPDNIDYAMWLKYTLNLVTNQISAVLNLTFGEMKNSAEFKKLAKKDIKEIKLIANKKGIVGLENLETDFWTAINRMCDEGKTSMLQDILAYRKTEVDIFAGEIIRLGKLYNIETPCNNMLYDLIKIKEEVNEHSIHTC